MDHRAAAGEGCGKYSRRRSCCATGTCRLGIAGDCNASPGTFNASCSNITCAGDRSSQGCDAGR
jgi:hypothetical protein